MAIGNPLLLLLGITLFSCTLNTKTAPPLRIWDNHPAISTIKDVKAG